MQLVALNENPIENSNYLQLRGDFRNNFFAQYFGSFLVERHFSLDTSLFAKRS